MKKISLLGIIVLLVYGNCSGLKIETQPDNFLLPDFTTEGKYTFACYVDGKVWKNAGNSSQPVGYSLSKYSFNVIHFDFIANKPYQPYTAFYIGGQMTFTGINSTLNIGVENKDLPKLGVYKITAMEYNDIENTKRYNFIDTLRPATINFIRFDTLTNIVSGRFEATLYSSSKKESKIEIKDGRFDVKH